MSDKQKKSRGMSMPAIMALGFVGIIVIGTFLLTLPIASRTGVFTDPVTAGFTAVSATCVTGLTVVNTAVHWSAFGQVVILVMIQIGGLGFMTMTVLLLLLIRHAVTPKERMMVAMSYNLSSYDNLNQLIRRIVVGTVSIEVVGAVLLFIRLVRHPGVSVGSAIWRSIFTSVSAFCNAGFDLMGEEGMGVFIDDPLINLTLVCLITLGGLGFVVWSDLWNLVRKRHHRLSVYTRLVLILTAILLMGGAVLFAAFEWNNPDTIGSLSVGDKLIASLFHSSTLRTAGFAMFDNGLMQQESIALSAVLMFIGGASGSTAGGVKIVTVGVLFIAVFSVAFGKAQPTIFKRRISSDAIIRAVSVIVMQLLFAFASILLLSLTTPHTMTEITYEVISAVSTVGLTLGITSVMPVHARLLVMCLMYFGRVGILTITYAIMVNLRKKQANVTYPDANLLIG